MDAKHIMVSLQIYGLSRWNSRPNVANHIIARVSK